MTGNLALVSPANTNAQITFYANAQTASNFSVFCAGAGYIAITNQGGTGVSMNNGSTSWTAGSDIREKKNIAKIKQLECHANVLKLNPVKFHYNFDDNTRDLRQGLIAQEVQKIFPEIVSEIKDGKLGIAYTELIPYMISSIKEQQKQIEALKAIVGRK